MHDSKIEWVLNPDNKTLGKIWNPITGCLNDCPYCYARKLANGRLKQRYLANKNIALNSLATSIRISPNEVGHIGDADYDRGLADPFYPRFWLDRLYEPCHIEKPVGIFAVDMGEFFGGWVPREWQDLIFSVIEATPQHRFYLLTKQPQNLIKWSPFPANCWVGISVTNNKQMNDALYFNPDYKAKIKFLSFEPLLERIDKSRLAMYRYDWVIIGACTGTLNDLETLATKYPDLTLIPYGKRWTLQPKIEWVLEIRDAATKLGIPIFLKDNLEPIFEADTKLHGFRQEMPK